MEDDIKDALPDRHGWIRLSLTQETFEKCLSLPPLTDYVASLLKMNRNQLEFMYIDGDFDRCLIRSDFEFRTWHEWNRYLMAPHFVWYRPTRLKHSDDDEKETGKEQACYVDDDAHHDDDQLTDRPSNAYRKENSDNKQPLKFRIIAEHSLALISSTRDEFLLKKRWTIRNIGGPWGDDDNLPVSISLVPLNLSHLSIVSTSLPSRCPSKSLSYVQIVFKQPRIGFTIDHSILYFQMGKVSKMNCRTNTNTTQTQTQRYSLFGERFKISFCSTDLDRLEQIHLAVSELQLLLSQKSFSVATLRIMCRAARDKIRREKQQQGNNALVTTHDIVCQVIDALHCQ